MARRSDPSADDSYAQQWGAGSTEQGGKLAACWARELSRGGRGARGSSQVREQLITGTLILDSDELSLKKGLFCWRRHSQLWCACFLGTYYYIHYHFHSSHCVAFAVVLSKLWLGQWMNDAGSLLLKLPKRTRVTTVTMTFSVLYYG